MKNSRLFRNIRSLSQLIVVVLAVFRTPPALAQAPVKAYSFTTLAGQSSIGTADGTGAAARFNTPSGIAMDGAGNLYVADSENLLIRKITSDGSVTTVAGSGYLGRTDGVGTGAEFEGPDGLAVDAAGNVFVADAGSGTIRKITPAGVVTTLAGFANPYDGSATVDGTGAGARFLVPTGIAIDAAGNLYVTDSGDLVVRKVTPAGVVTTLAGKPAGRGTTDGTGAAARFTQPSGIVVDRSGSVYVADAGNLRKISPTGDVTTVKASGLRADGGLALDASGTLYFLDRNSGTVSKLSPAGVVSQIVGALRDPRGIVVSANGTLYVTEANNNVVRVITAAGVASTFAGLPTTSSVGSTNGVGSSARFNYPEGIAVDAAGNLYVAESQNQTIRKITPLGATTFSVTTLAGAAGQQGNVDGTGAAARFSYPYGVAVDATGNVYVADQGNATIRKITPAGVVTTMAGKGSSGAAVDGTGAAARFVSPAGLAIDRAGNLYVGDGATVRKVTPAGVVTTMAGRDQQNGAADGVGSAARFGSAEAIAVDGAGNIYVGDKGNGTIRKITASGVVTTLAGTAPVSTDGNRVGGFADGTGPTASFQYINALAVDVAGNVLVGDAAVLRIITPSGVVRTVAGLSNANGSADGTGSAARFSTFGGLAFDASGAIYATDYNNTVRKGVPSATTLDVRMGNLSVRTTAGAGAQTLTVGFVVASGQKSLLIRGIGPALAQFGLTGVLADPQLGLYSGSTLTASNNDWGTAANATQVASVAATLGGFALPTGSKDAALFTTLGTGAYTVQLSGGDGGTGVALVELYDADATASSRFFNASARAQVGSGAGILIAGFSVAGNTPKTVLVRGVGPTLGAFGVPGVLADPQLAIFRGGEKIAANDNWGDDAASGQMAAAAAQVGAFALGAGSKDAVLLLSLRPGSYTAQISGAGGTTGVALVEIYEVP